MTMAVRAAIYVRISKDRTGEALGIQRQEDDCRQLATRLGWDVVDTYSDNDLSAYSGKPRPGYRAMLEDIDAGKLDAIITWDTSRLYRQLYDLLELIDLFDANGLTTIATVKAGDMDLSTPAGRTNAVILARISQQYSEENSGRIKRKKRELAERGMESGGGNRPFGFTGAGRNKVSLNRALMEQEAIKDAVGYLLTGGTITGLARDWNARGVPTVNGGKWRAAHIRSILVAPRIAGYTSYDGRLYEASWAPIVDRQEWARLRELITDPSRVTNKGSNNLKYLLTGSILCGLCGNRITGTVKKRYEGGRPISAMRIYKCSPSTGGCNKITRQAGPIEELLLEAIFQAVESEAWDARIRETSSDDDEVQKLLERRATVTGLLDRLEDKVARELITEPAYKRNRMELEDELEGISRKLARLQDDSIVPAVPRNLRAVWSDLAFDRQRAIVGVVLRSIGRRVVLYPQHSRYFDPDSVKLETQS
jgi:DNA invertase Pin-like site-specific DNA recombinase